MAHPASILAGFWLSRSEEESSPPPPNPPNMLNTALSPASEASPNTLAQAVVSRWMHAIAGAILQNPPIICCMLFPDVALFPDIASPSDANMERPITIMSAMAVCMQGQAVHMQSKSAMTICTETSAEVELEHAA